MTGIGNWLRELLRGAASQASPPPPAPSDTEVAEQAAPSEATPASPQAEGQTAAPSMVDSEPPAAPDISEGQLPAPLRAAFTTGWVTDTGAVRGHNEDAVMVFVSQQDASQAVLPFGLFIVADGMGGHQKGEAASSLAIRVAAGQLLSQVYLPLLSGHDRSSAQPSLAEIMRDAVFGANRAVTADLPGSGSTLTCGMILGDRLFMGHVGDSRAYLLRNGAAPRRLTKDHSYVTRLMEMGQLTQEEALVHPQRNVLYRAIGQSDGLEVDVATYALQSGDTLLLCSDGLWNMLEEEEMWRIVGELAHGEDSSAQNPTTALPDPQAVCEQLVQAALDAGGSDNISVILTTIYLGDW